VVYYEIGDIFDLVEAWYWFLVYWELENCRIWVFMLWCIQHCYI